MRSLVGTFFLSLPGLTHGCPVEFLWTRRMALISAVSRTSGNVSGQQSGNAMQHKNSVFHDLLKHVPWAGFKELIEQHGADFRVRSLPSKNS